MKPIVALTFDDGPSQWTNGVLDVLTRWQARATFFVLGQHVSGNELTLKRMVHEGHEIGMHGWSHSRLIELSLAEFRGEIRLTDNAIRQACGYRSRLWRSPWNNTPDWAFEELVKSGIHHVGIDVDSYDCDRDADAIVADVLPKLETNKIVCLHDGVAPNGVSSRKTRDQTVSALHEILGSCRSTTVSRIRAYV